MSYRQYGRYIHLLTVEDDRGLGDIVVETLYKHSQWLDKEEVREICSGAGEL